MKHVVITIGREYGSGGRLIAKKLSEELGITFYDKELIAAVAKKTGFSENFIRDTEHQRPTNSFLYDLYTHQNLFCFFLMLAATCSPMPSPA